MTDLNPEALEAAAQAVAEIQGQMRGVTDEGLAEIAVEAYVEALPS